MATPAADHIVAALLHEAAVAELLPTTLTEPSSGATDPRSLSKFFPTGPRGNVVGQIEFPIDQTWLTVKAFTSFTPFTTLAPTTSDITPLLQCRMRFLELLARVSMTRQCDWQTNFAPTDLLDTATTDDFHWCHVLRGLMGDATWATPRTQRALATLRWHHPRFLLQWPLVSLVDTFPEWLEIFLLGTSSSTDHDDAWIESDALRALLLADEKDHTRRVPRVVELGVEICSGLVTSSMLLRLVDVLERVGEIQTQRRLMQDNAGIEFRVTTLMFSCICALSSSAMEQFGELLRDSEHIYVSNIQLTEPERADDVSFQRCLASLIAPRVSTLVASTPAPPLKRLWLENESKPFAAVGSAVRHDTTTHIQELSAMYAPGDMNDLAVWLAFGVFHCDSQSNVKALKLTMPRNTYWNAQSPPSFGVISAQWIEVFTRALSHVASASDLAPLDPPAKPKKKKTNTPAMEELLLPADKREFVHVKRNTKARRQPRASSELVATLAAPAAHDEDEQLSEYQVVRKLRGWLAVVVPGAGAGWIPRSAVVNEFTRESHVSPTHSHHHHQLKSFTWAFDTAPRNATVAAQHADSLMDLLALIGEPLEVLQLPNMGLESRHVARILEHCPNLKELNLCDNNITDVEPLVRAYELGICKISSLNIAQDFTTVSHVIPQCNTILTLCNQRHGDATRTTIKRPTIQQLVLRVSAIVSEADFTELFHTIQRDTTLEYVRVSCSPSRAETLLAAVHAHSKDNDQPIVLRSRVLPLTNKLATLSVVHHASTQLSALSSLDAGVLALIFRLARTSHPFLVEIRADEHDL